MRKKWKQWQILFSWAPKPLWTLTAATKLKDTCSLEGREAMKNLDSVLKTRDSLCYRGLQCHSYDFASNHVQMCDLDQKKGWMPKNWAFELWSLRILESPLYNKEIKPVNLKGNQPVTPADSAEASTEGFQVERTDASTSKVPNHGSFKQIVCSSTPGGSSERLKALCILGPLIHVLHSLQQHWGSKKGHSGPWRCGMAQGFMVATTYQLRL